VQKNLITTADGSHSLSIPDLNITYHSVHGAIQESKHVFIEAGLQYLIETLAPPKLNIFEMGFGTGLNAFLTAIEAERHRVKIDYTSIEKFPLSDGETSKLNYPGLLQQEYYFSMIHESPWGEHVTISEYFTLCKEKADLIGFISKEQFNLIYYDAFAPNAQPELWTKKIFKKLFDLLKRDGILVTYCSKGDVRRAMIAAGFALKKLPGPPGKREMLRAIKLC